MYDDDGILYYKGRAYWKYDDIKDEPDEDDSLELFCWGQRDAGTVLLRYHGRPDWTIG